jgi:hypothetical protein
MRKAFFNSIGHNPKVAHRNGNGRFTSITEHQRGRNLPRLPTANAEASVAM